MVFIRRLLGLAVIAVSLLVGLFAVAFWTNGGDGTARTISIFFGILSMILFFIGARWSGGSSRHVSWRDDPATDRQKSFADDLGIQYHKGITKGALSDLISQVTGK